jgi:plastocyanin
MSRKRIWILFIAVLAWPALIFAAATITGETKYREGDTPMKQRPIDMSKEPTCAAQHPTPIKTETVVTGPNNALANVVVYISAGAPDETTVPSQAVTYEQKGCQYLPHVLAMQTGQELKILNDDKTSHNIHPMPKINSEWNKSQPSGAPPIDTKWEKAEFIPVKCNIHPWMHGYFVVLKTSHYAVSNDDGAFSLPDLPPGKYTITAWHEKYGTLSQDVTIGGDETKTIKFVFKATPY